MAPEAFFEGPDRWHRWERRELAALSGPVLDLGCGAGRHSFELQRRGVPVTAVDASPGAVEVCRAGGLLDVCLGDLRSPPDDHPWQAVLLLCGNLGLAGGWDETRDLLRRLSARCASGAVLLADTVDPGTGGCDVYRLRLHYDGVRTPWWSPLCVGAERLPDLVADTGWTIGDITTDDRDVYVRLLRS